MFHSFYNKDSMEYTFDSTTGFKFVEDWEDWEGYKSKLVGHHLNEPSYFPFLVSTDIWMNRYGELEYSHRFLYKHELLYLLES